jgi:hypothetical protein
MNVATIIQQERKRQGLSQGDLGKAVGLSTSSISWIETGRPTSRGPSTVIRISPPEPNAISPKPCMRGLGIALIKDWSCVPSEICAYIVANLGFVLMCTPHDLPLVKACSNPPQC